MTKKRSLNMLEKVNKDFDLNLKVNDILVGHEIDVETDPDGDQYACETTWYCRLIEKNDQYYIVQCDPDGNYDDEDICKDSSLQYITKDELYRIIEDMTVLK